MTLGDGSVAQERAHFAVGAGQPFTFGSPTAVLGHSVDMSVHLLLDPNGTPSGTDPLFTVTLTGDLVAAPEPATLTLLGLGLASLALTARRRQ